MATKFKRRIRYRMYLIRQRPRLQMQYMSLAFFGAGVFWDSKEVMALSLLAWLYFFATDGRKSAEESDKASQSVNAGAHKNHIVDLDANHVASRPKKADYTLVAPWLDEVE